MTGPGSVPLVRRRRSAAGIALMFVVAATLPAGSAAQNQTGNAATGASNVDQVIQQETFATPPREILDAVLAPRHLNVSLSDPSPDRLWFLNEIGDGPVGMEVFSQPYHELGGLFIDFRAHRSRSLTVRSDAGLEIISAADGSRREIDVPDGARVSGASWSPDGRSVAFLAHFPDASHVYVADVASGDSRRLTRTPLLATLVTGIDWVGEGRIAAVLIPENRPPMPVDATVPQGPRVKLAEESDQNRLRTYASLMATPHDQALLEWHTTGQVALIDVRSRAVTRFGRPDLIRSLDFSPDGRYVRVTRMVKPFSYVVPVNNFATVQEVWDAEGNVLVKLDEEPINLGVRADRPPTAPGVGGGQDDDDGGPRDIAWRSDGAGLIFLEQEPAREESDSAAADEPEQDEGRDRQRRRDRLMQWAPPFDSASLTVLYENDARMSNVRFSPDYRVLFASERSGRNTHEFAVYLDQPGEKHTLARYRTEDVYADPGDLVGTRGGLGGGGGFGGGRFGGGGGSGPVQLSADGEHVFYYGTQYDREPLENGPRTFIDRVAIRTGEKERVFESDNDGVYERVLTVIDPDASRLVISRESPTEVPQSYLLAGGQRTQLTQNRDYTPDLTRAPRQSFTVERPDGFRFRVNVTLPPDYQSGQPLPAMFWFYPREYPDQEEYDRGARTFNRNEFPNFGTRSMEYLVRLGYAVVEPDAPIVGPEGRMNNNYEHDLRNNLAAVIDELDRRGVIDRTRIGIGGHSYGAFSTVNAMVHTPFFKAGIAGDGAYNRTLTPLGFQRERRDFWEAKDVYLSMSPFMHANNLTGALLLYHGMADQNVGTDPINSPRLFHALNGLGKTVSMYLYPFEDHGPATRETLLDLWARWAAWLDKYVKNAGKGTEAKVTTQEGSS